MIVPIQTEYNAYKFRSRLEARWAVFFDLCGIRYEYEPEGFQLDKNLRYLPDFRIRDVILINERGNGDYLQELYIEVKGSPTKRDFQKMNRFDYPTLIVGDIPPCEYAEDVIRYIRSDYCQRREMPLYNTYWINGEDRPCIPSADWDGNLVLEPINNETYWIFGELTMNAYRKAKQERFEYGDAFKAGYQRYSNQRIKKEIGVIDGDN